jgi:hypothetical protein
MVTMRRKNIDTRRYSGVNPYFMKIRTVQNPTTNSTTGYFQDIRLWHDRHSPRRTTKLITGIRSYHEILLAQSGQNDLFDTTDKD